MINVFEVIRFKSRSIKLQFDSETKVSHSYTHEFF